MREHWAIHVSESAGSAFLRHAGEKFGGKARHDGRWDANLRETAGGKCDLKRGGRGRGHCDGATKRRGAQPILRRRGILHSQERIRGLRHLPVAETDETLHVAVVDFAHRSATHSRTSCSFSEVASKPCRMRPFRSRSIAVKPG